MKCDEYVYLRCPVLHVMHRLHVTYTLCFDSVTLLNDVYVHVLWQLIKAWNYGLIELIKLDIWH